MPYCVTDNYGQDGSLPVDNSKKRTLEELFKPPLDIMFKGDWQAARETAEAANKWLLVNIQVQNTCLQILFIQSDLLTVYFCLYFYRMLESFSVKF